MTDTKPQPRALVLTGHGINCDDETYWALMAAGAIAKKVHLNDLIDGHDNLSKYQILFFPGGFSYGDDLGAGQALAARIKAKLSDDIKEFAQGDKLMTGICNGFQDMVKLVFPGFDGNYDARTVTLAQNESSRYEDRWVHLVKPAVHDQRCIAARDINQIYLPVAHGEGRLFADPATINRLENEGLVVFRYSLANGIPAKGKFPENPNGAVNDIAGICDQTGRIFGMMPHPERCLKFTNHPHWAKMKYDLMLEGKPLPEEGEGMKFFRNMVEYFK